MSTITTEIIIDASKEVVWKVLMDFAAYQEWNPFIKQIVGDRAVGNQLSVQIQPPGQKDMQFTPQILVCEQDEEFRWLGKLGVKGLFDGEHYFRLEAIADQQTKFIHGENFSGLFTGIILSMIGKNTRLGFIAMNEALKNRVEGN
jgi:hypothetical protein